MKRINLNHPFFSLFFLVVLISSCEKENPKSLPILTSIVASGITDTSAYSGGVILDNGNANIIKRGVCWSSNQTPTINDFKTEDGVGIGTYTSKLLGLKALTTYYLRAYAANSVGIAYGNETSFITNAGAPIISTLQVSLIAQTYANIEVNIISDGGSAITASGVCWGITQLPSITNSKTSENIGSGEFTSNLTGLMPNTIFYARAYAANSVGIAYGSIVTFKTSAIDVGTMTDIDDNDYNTITIGTQVWMKENLKTTHYSDGTLIPLVTDNYVWGTLSTPGYCWYNNDQIGYNKYGIIYNGYTVETGKLCPTGWHVPTEDEWVSLVNNLGGTDIAGGKLKEIGTTDWINPNMGATNDIGFSALPGGTHSENNEFWYLGQYAMWWTSSSESSTRLTYILIGNSSTRISIDNTGKRYGFSVRCLKN